MAKPREIELADGTQIPILYEDRSALGIDKPPGWMLAPSSWERTGRNLQLALESGILARDFWATSRNLKFLRFVHRLDAETSGVLLLAKSLGAVKAFQQMFETRRMQKVYLAVVSGVPEKNEWVCRAALAQAGRGRMRAIKERAPNPKSSANNPKHQRPPFPPEAKPAETHFRVLQSGERTALVEARPLTGRTHQIRVHLASEGYPVLGDELYGAGERGAAEYPLALRAIELEYPDPFTGRPVHIAAPVEGFLKAFGFSRPKQERVSPPHAHDKP